MEISYFANLPWLAALASAVLAVVGLGLGWRASEHRLFGLALMALAMEQLFVGFSLAAVRLENVVFWNHLASACSALAPGLWLWFVLRFSRGRRQMLGAQATWLSGVVLVVPVSLALLAVFSSPAGLPSKLAGQGWFVPLSPVGYWLQVSLLIAATVTVAALEGVLRASVGGQRWRVKFLALGLGCLFGFRIYLGSQILLFRGDAERLRLIDSMSVLLALGLLAIALSRDSRLKVDLFPSVSLIYRSITVLVVGVYLLALAVLVELFQRFDWVPPLGLTAFLVLFALVALSAALLSDRLRYATRQFVTRHLKRPQYDYRQIWNSFTRRSASVVEESELCRMVSEFMAETLQILLVTVWVYDEATSQLRFGASTFWLPGQAEEQDPTGDARRTLLDLVRQANGFVDLRTSELVEAARLRETALRPDAEQETIYCLALVSREEFVGAVTLGKRVGDIPFGVEELDLVAVIAEQAAAGILNLKLAERLQRAKQMEAFQSMSAFFVHDLKNLASRLSLTMDNLPTYYDDPEFREDALQTMGRSIEKIKALIGRMSVLKEKLELKRADVDLSELVRATLEEMKSSLKGSVATDLAPLPRVRLDPEQIQKVLVNLLINAREAGGPEGGIHVSTSLQGSFVALRVMDQGPGMSREFMERRLFRPFQTTKPGGVGVGLFQSKMIVEAHHGRIEVESGIGKGSAFRVLLPISSPNLEEKRND